MYVLDDETCKNTGQVGGVALSLFPEYHVVWCVLPLTTVLVCEALPFLCTIGDDILPETWWQLTRHVLQGPQEMGIHLSGINDTTVFLCVHRYYCTHQHKYCYAVTFILPHLFSANAFPTSCIMYLK